MKITLDWLAERDACAAAREAFAEKFPDGATYTEAQAALHDENRADWSWWLVDALYRGLLDSPADVTMQNVDAHCAKSRSSVAAHCETGSCGHRPGQSPVMSRYRNNRR